MENLIAHAQGLEAQLMALRTICGILVAHSPEALDSLGRLQPYLRDLLLVQPLTEQQLELALSVHEQVFSEARRFAEQLQQVELPEEPGTNPISPP